MGLFGKKKNKKDDKNISNDIMIEKQKIDVNSLFDDSSITKEDVMSGLC